MCASEDRISYFASYISSKHADLVTLKGKFSLKALCERHSNSTNVVKCVSMKKYWSIQDGGLYQMMFSVKCTENKGNLHVIAEHFEHMSMFHFILSPII